MRSIVWVAAGICLVLALATAFFAGRLMMAPPSAVVEVRSVDSPALLAATLLERRRSGYMRTNSALQIRVSPQTTFVMGDRSALKAGAVLGVDGDRHGAELDADRVVVLTGYVRVR
ncbi:MAG TPA: hypothetical protein VGX91_10135 [Candidatus Cybelea sp.]|jgi:hypothetical protein|nr:hypothetical protein [Candidatus Cybelea sp.]